VVVVEYVRVVMEALLLMVLVLLDLVVVLKVIRIAQFFLEQQTLVGVLAVNTMMEQTVLQAAAVL
jgi:hypothetical protein